MLMLKVETTSLKNTHFQLKLQLLTVTLSFGACYSENQLLAVDSQNSQSDAPPAVAHTYG